jgi:hypothetical protein
MVENRGQLGCVCDENLGAVKLFILLVGSPRQSVVSIYWFAHSLHVDLHKQQQHPRHHRRRTVHQQISYIDRNSNMRTCLLSLALIGTTTASWSSRSSVVNPPSFVLSIRGGANEYETKFEGVKCSVIEKASKKVGSCV